MLERAFDSILEDDLLYRVFRGQGKTLSRAWKAKRAVRLAGARLLPAPVVRRIGAANEVAYFRYHRLRPRHWLAMRRNLRAGHLKIGVMSGFGDVLDLYPYLKCFRRKYPDHRITVVMHHERYTRYRALAHVRHREVTLPDGSSVDFVREFLETNPNVDEIVYDDAWGDGHVFSWQPLLRREFGEQFRPSSFREDLPYLWTADDKATMASFRARHGLEGRFTIGIHFKTCGEFVEPLVRRLIEAHRGRGDVFFIACGAPPGDILEALGEAEIPHADLSASYDKGINTRSLLGILAGSDLFIAGRGGFGAFPRLCGVPSLNVWDLQGEQEILAGLSPSQMWEGNPFPSPFYWHSTSVDELTTHAIQFIRTAAARRQSAE